MKKKYHYPAIVTPPTRVTTSTNTTAAAASPVLTLAGTHAYSWAAIVAADVAAMAEAIVQQRWRGCKTVQEPQGVFASFEATGRSRPPAALYLAYCLPEPERAAEVAPPGRAGPEGCRRPPEGVGLAVP